MKNREMDKTAYLIRGPLNLFKSKSKTSNREKTLVIADWKQFIITVPAIENAEALSLWECFIF